MHPAIKVKGLTKKFGEFMAVDHISFEVGKGEIFGFFVFPANFQSEALAGRTPTL